MQSKKPSNGHGAKRARISEPPISTAQQADSSSTVSLSSISSFEPPALPYDNSDEDSSRFARMEQAMHSLVQSLQQPTALITAALQQQQQQQHYILQQQHQQQEHPLTTHDLPFKMPANTDKETETVLIDRPTWRNDRTGHPWSISPLCPLSGGRNHAPIMLMYAYLIVIKLFCRDFVGGAHNVLVKWASAERMKSFSVSRCQHFQLERVVNDHIDKALRSQACVDAPVAASSIEAKPIRK